MDTGKVYYDTEGNECSIWRMVMREPHWAANRIQEGEKAIEEIARLQSELDAARVAMDSASKQMADFIHLANNVGINDADGFYLAAALEAKTILDAAIDAARGGK